MATIIEHADIVEQWVSVSDPVQDLKEAHLYDELVSVVEASTSSVSVLYRGSRHSSVIDKPTIDYTGRLSSWSTDLEVAQTFAGENGVVLEWQTPSAPLLDIRAFNKYESEVIAHFVLWVRRTVLSSFNRMNSSSLHCKVKRLVSYLCSL